MKEQRPEGPKDGRQSDWHQVLHVLSVLGSFPSFGSFVLGLSVIWVLSFGSFSSFGSLVLCLSSKPKKEHVLVRLRKADPVDCFLAGLSHGVGFRSSASRLNLFNRQNGPGTVARS